MSHSAGALYKMSEMELLAAYAEARRQFVEKKFAATREMARELDLVKVEVDIIANVIRFRGAPAPAGMHEEDAGEGASGHEGYRAASD